MKYKMIPEGDMFRIEAVVDIPRWGIKVGDRGGLMQAEYNLSQEGDAWIYGDALVSGNARVYGDAWVSGNAQVSGNAWVSGNAQVSGDARVSGDVWVSGDARVYGDALVYGNARVYGDAQIYGNARIYGNAQVLHSSHTTRVINLILSKHSITVDGDFINIGCQSYSLDHWLKHYKKIGASNGYSDEQIKEYGAALRFIKRTYFKGETK